MRSLPVSVACLAFVVVGCSGSSPGADGGSARASFPPPPSPSPSPSSAAAATTPAGPNLDDVRLRLTEIGRFDEPVALVHQGAALYVAEKAGRVLSLEPDGTSEVLDMTDRTSSNGEQGLLGLAFSPDGTHLYVSYTNNDGDSRVDEYSVREGASGLVADPASRREVLALDQPYPNHNGGQIVFGPDGMLYVGYGDGGSGGDPQRHGQDPRTWLGKLLRIDPRPNGDQPYRVPPDNPYADGSQALPEIWSAGLRNPWRFSFDSATGDLWVGDVGQDAIEEVDLVPAAQGAGRGTNFGWSAFEGSARFNEDQQAPGQWAPIYEYRHGDAGCSVTGGVVYRGAAIPALAGAYLFGDYCAGGITALVVEGGQLVDTARVTDEPAQVVSFGTDGNGEVYVLSLGGGVYRLDPA